MIHLVLGVIDIPFDPVLVRFGGIGIHWYGVAYVVAFAVGIKLTSGYLRGRGFTDKQVSDGYWWTIAMGLLGGRLFFVVQQPNLVDYLRHPIEIIAVWQGGMAFFGAIIAAVSTIVIYTYVHRLPLWITLDAGALFATLPQAIGRIGNIINGDILGPPSNLPWAVRYTNPHSFAPQGIAYQPAAAYEMLGSLVLFAVIGYIIRRGAAPGMAIITYLVLYPISQLLLFFLRSTEPVLVFGLKQAQITSLVMLVIIVPVVVVLRWRYPLAFAGREASDTAATMRHASEAG